MCDLVESLAARERTKTEDRGAFKLDGSTSTEEPWKSERNLNGGIQILRKIRRFDW